MVLLFIFIGGRMDQIGHIFAYTIILIDRYIKYAQYGY